MAAAGHRVAFVFKAPKSGSIRTVHYRTVTVAIGDTVRVSIQGVNASGLPDGIVKGAGNAYFNSVIADTDDHIWKAGQLTADLPVTYMEPIAVDFSFPSYVAGNLNLYRLDKLFSGYQNSYYVGTFNGTTWTKSNSFLSVILEYDDGSFAFWGGWGVGGTSGGFSNITTVTEHGIYIQTPAQVEVSGLWFYGNYTDVFSLKLYDSDGSVLRSISFPAGFYYSNSSSAPVYEFFSTPVTLEPNTWYRAVLVPESSTNITVPNNNFPDAAMMACYIGGDKCYRTQKSSGVWSQDATVRPFLGLIISKIHDGAGSGGGAVGPFGTMR
ncbi:MAG: hypothetical protein AB1805_07520 [Nitrospirota bacterium]